MRVTLVVLAFIFSTVVGETEKKDESLREKKLISLFSIVSFPNEGCASLDPGRNGTCYTLTECADKGGTSSGNCAAGFGVCCLFIVKTAAATINQNCTYIQNPSFPSVYDSQTALTYTISKCSADVCSVRLDFETFSIVGPADTEETDGGACTDSFVASGTSGLSSPVICGLNAGQHIYMEMGNSGSTDVATLAFTFAGPSTARVWEIKATQIPCGANYRQPEGCLQYHTELTGRFQTFNFQDTTTPQHLANQDYGVCIRQEDGYCCIQYSKCDDDNSYSLSHKNAADAADVAVQDTNCLTDWLGISGVSATCNQNSGGLLHTKLCGAIGVLNTIHTDQIVSMTAVCDCTAPFIAQIRTDGMADHDDPDTTVQRGLCLEYKQIPCN